MLYKIFNTDFFLTVKVNLHEGKIYPSNSQQIDLEGKMESQRLGHRIVDVCVHVCVFQPLFTHTDSLSH